MTAWTSRLREHLRPGEKLRLIDVHELFQVMKDHMNVWIYVDTRHGVGDTDHVRVFASAAAARACLP